MNFIEGNPKRCCICKDSCTTYIKLDTGLFYCKKCIRYFKALFGIIKKNKNIDLVDQKAVICSLCSDSTTKYIKISKKSVACHQCLRTYGRMYDSYKNGGNFMTGLGYKHYTKLIDLLEK